MGRAELRIFLEGKTDWAVLCKLVELGIIRGGFEIRTPGAHPYDKDCGPYESRGGLPFLEKNLGAFMKKLSSEGLKAGVIVIRDMDRGDHEDYKGVVNLYWGMPDFAREWGFEKKFTLEDHLLFCLDRCQDAFEKKWPGLPQKMNSLRGNKNIEASEEVLEKIRRFISKKFGKMDEVKFFTEILETACEANPDVLEESFAALIDEWPKP